VQKRLECYGRSIQQALKQFSLLRPPGAPPLAYHRDSPYFMFKPNDVCTVWIALDDLSSDLGPLQYVKSSHLWGDGRVGSSQNFFQDDGGKALLHSAAERAGIDIRNLEFESMAGVAAGGISIHGENLPYSAFELFYCITCDLINFCM